MPDTGGGAGTEADAGADVDWLRAFQRRGGGANAGGRDRPRDRPPRDGPWDGGPRDGREEELIRAFRSYALAQYVQEARESPLGHAVMTSALAAEVVEAEVVVEVVKVRTRILSAPEMAASEGRSALSAVSAKNHPDRTVSTILTTTLAALAALLLVAPLDLADPPPATRWVSVSDVHLSSPLLTLGQAMLCRILASIQAEE